MEALVQILDSYGYGLLFLIGFAEFAGLPIAAVPMLVVSGALARAGGLSLPVIAASVALGGLVADAIWYGAARWAGGRLVAVACALVSNRHACVDSVERKVRRVGPIYILFAKFIPGAGNLIALAAGYGGVAARRFLLFDGAGLLAWALVHAGAGWLFSDQVEALLVAAAGYSRWILWSFLLLIVAGACSRLGKLRGLREEHPATPESLQGA